MIISGVYCDANLTKEVKLWRGKKLDVFRKQYEDLNWKEIKRFPLSENPSNYETVIVFERDANFHDYRRYVVCYNE